jgi:hypothetical protein
MPASFDQDLYQPRIYVPGVEPPIANAGFDGFTAGAPGMTRYALALNDEIGWDVALGPGSWVVTVEHWRNADEGIFTAYLGDDELGVVYCYGAAPETFVLSGFPAIDLDAPEVRRVRVRITGKNAASSGHVVAINGIYLRRTA